MSPKLVESEACVECDGTRWVAVESEDGWSAVRECPACKQRESTEDPLVAAGVPARERTWLATGLKPPQVRAYAECVKALVEGESVLLAGPAGRGKSGVAVCLLRDRALTGSSVAWCHVPTWLRLVRDSFSAEGGPREAELIGHFLSVDVLVVDDLGSEHVTDWARAMVHALVDGRDSSMRPTVFTSNLALRGEKSVESVYGERVASRLNRCKRIALAEGPDMRARRVERPS